MDFKTINEKLAEGEHEYQCNSIQQEFIREIVSFVRQNGGTLFRWIFLNRDPFRKTFNLDNFSEKTNALLGIVKMFHDVIAPEAA